MERKINVVVVMGGWSPEAPVSLRSGLNAYRNLPGEKYLRRAVVLTSDRKAVLLAPETEPTEAAIAAAGSPVPMTEAFGQVLAWPVEAALLALHGCGGEDGCFQGFLSTLGIPFTHSGVTASAAAMEKDVAKLLYSAAGVRVPRGVTVFRGEDVAAKVAKAGLAFPVIAKPLASGSSFGLKLIESASELEQVVPEFWKDGEGYLLEEFVSGKEFTCVVLTENGRPKALPVTEIVSRTGLLFDYEAKYTKGSSEEITPARIDAVLTSRIQDAAERCHAALRCSGVSRTDFMVDPSGEIFALETNTIPGMSEASILPKVAVAAGLTFGEVLDGMVQEALKSR